MTRSCSPLFASEIVTCIAENRQPTPMELVKVAERIGREVGGRSAFSWANAPAETILLRAAHLALCGDDKRGITLSLEAEPSLQPIVTHNVGGPIRIALQAWQS